MIPNLFASKFADVLNNHSSSTQESLYSSFQASVKTCHLSDVLFSADEVLEALSMLKSKKSDGDGVYSEHLKFAFPAIAKPLASFLTSFVRHGHMPQCLSDCVLIPYQRAIRIHHAARIIVLLLLLPV